MQRNICAVNGRWKPGVLNSEQYIFFSKCKELTQLIIFAIFNILYYSLKTILFIKIKINLPYFESESYSVFHGIE